MTRMQVSNIKPGAAESFSRTDYEYNGRNFLTAAVSYDNGAAANRVDYEYDAVGNKTKMKTANGANVTVYEYNNLNRLTKLTDPLGQFESYVYDTKGNLTQKTGQERE